MKRFQHTYSEQIKKILIFFSYVKEYYFNKFVH
jgi:hypothetical protein